MASREATREASTLFVEVEEEDGPRDTGVRVSNEGRGRQGRVPGNMRYDKGMDMELDRGFNVIKDAVEGHSSMVEEVMEEDEIVDNAEGIGEDIE